MKYTTWVQLGTKMNGLVSEIKGRGYDETEVAKNHFGNLDDHAFKHLPSRAAFPVKAYQLTVYHAGSSSCFLE